MEMYYYELRVYPSSHAELFSDFLMSFTSALEEDAKCLIVRSDEPLDELVFGVEEFAKRLSSALNSKISARCEMTKKQNEDWIRKYQASVTPAQIGAIYVRPSWAEAKPYLTEVVIDPALAFGSGHHESTYGCLLMLQRYTELGSRLLDVGTGSGILAIAATKLGAIADICDTDAQALEAARENFAKNSARFKNAWTGSANEALEHNGGIKYNLITANIIADVLLMIERDLSGLLIKDGVLILSGILDKYAENIKAAYANLSLIDEFISNEWHTLVFKR